MAFFASLRSAGQNERLHPLQPKAMRGHGVPELKKRFPSSNFKKWGENEISLKSVRNQFEISFDS